MRSLSTSSTSSVLSEMRRVFGDTGHVRSMIAVEFWGAGLVKNGNWGLVVVVLGRFAGGIAILSGDCEKCFCAEEEKISRRRKLRVTRIPGLRDFKAITNYASQVYAHIYFLERIRVH